MDTFPDTRNTIDETVMTYTDMIYKIAIQNLKRKSDCEDVIQEVFIKFMKEQNFADEFHKKAWLIRVTINQCRDFNKTAWYRKTESLVNHELPFTMEEETVLHELDKLSTNYKNVIYLYYYEKYTISEIASIMKKNENTISSQLTRARKKLKLILSEGGYNDE